MNIHEYQAKELLAKYGIGIPAGHAALTVEEAVEGAKKLPGPLYVVKAQIHAGGPARASSPNWVPMRKAAYACRRASKTWKPMPRKCSAIRW